MSKNQNENAKEKVQELSKGVLIHRNVLGLLGMLLPFISLLGGAFVKDKPASWWYSISVTYYITPALTLILGSCSIFFLCYRSYDKIDTVINSLSGIFALGVVLFPCANPYGIEYTGFFQIPTKVSDVIHTVSAILLFLFLAYNIGFLFTKGRSKKRNIIYKTCSIIMIVVMVIFAFVMIAKNFIPAIPEWIVFVVEVILLFAFGFAWLVKGRAILKNLD